MPRLTEQGQQEIIRVQNPSSCTSKTLRGLIK